MPDVNAVIRTDPSTPRAKAAAFGSRTPWLGALLPALGIAGFAAAWIMLGVFTSRQNSWMAVLAALDIAWMLRLGGWHPGAARAAVGMAATTLTVLLANWGITASHLGLAMGLQSWDSALRLGFDHAWTLAQLANHAGDVLWLALALGIAALASR